MHVFLALGFGREMEYFTLSGQCELHSTLGGKSSLRLVEAKSFVPSEAQFYALG